MKKSLILGFILIIFVVISSCSVFDLDQQNAKQVEEGIELAETQDAFTNIPSSYFTKAVLIDKNIAYVGMGDCVYILQFSNPYHFDKIGHQCGLQGDVNSITLLNDLLYVAAGNSLQILDVFDPAVINEISSFQAEAIINSIFISENIVYLAAGELGVQMLDVSTPSKPAAGGLLDTPGSAKDIEVVGERAYVADGDSGIRIFDISSLAAPVEIGFFDTPGISKGISIYENTAYVADGENGLSIIDISDPIEPSELGNYDTIGDAQKVKVGHNHAFLADGENGLRVLEVTDPSNPTLIGFYTTADEVLDVQVSRGIAYIAAGLDGLRVVDLIGKEPLDRFLKGKLFWFLHPETTQLYFPPITPTYEIIEFLSDFAFVIGQSHSNPISAEFIEGLQILDVSDLENIKVRGTLKTRAFEFIVDSTIEGNYLYILDRSKGLNIIDISDPSVPEIISSSYMPRNTRSIKIINGFAYVTGAGFGLRIYDVSNPEIIERYDSSEMFWDGEDIQISERYAYVTAGKDGLKILDISDPKNPFELSSFPTPEYAKGMAVKGNLVYIADGRSGLRVIDVSNPTNPFELSFYDILPNSQYVAISGDLVFITDDVIGIRVFDISDPNMPIQVGYSEDLPIDKVKISEGKLFTNNFYGHFWDISKIKNTADLDLNFVISKRVTNPTIIDSTFISEEMIFDESLESLEWVENISIIGNNAYLSNDYGITIFDISDPLNPIEMGNAEVPGSWRVAVSGDFAYIASLKKGLVILDISDLENPIEVGSYDTPGEAADIAVVGNYAYVCDYEHGMRIIDVSDPSNSFEVGSYDDRGQARRVVVVDDIAYLANGLEGFTIIDVSNPASPTRIANLSFVGGGQALGIGIVGDYAYVAWNSGLQTVDISNPAEPIEVVGEWGYYEIFSDIAIKDNLAFLTQRTSWGNTPSELVMFDITNQKEPAPISIIEVTDNMFIGDVEIKGDYAFVQASGKLKTYKITNPRAPSELAEHTYFDGK